MDWVEFVAAPLTLKSVVGDGGLVEVRLFKLLPVGKFCNPIQSKTF